MVDEFLQRAPSTERDIHTTYNQYQSALAATQFAFFAKRFPKVLDPVRTTHNGGHTRKFGLLDNSLAALSKVALASEQVAVIKHWCLILAKPVLKWQPRLTEIMAKDMRQLETIHEISRTRIPPEDWPETKESIAQAYQTYRTELLATTHGHLFNDFPVQIHPTDWELYFKVRGRLIRELKTVQKRLSNEANSVSSELSTQALQLKIRLKGLNDLQHLIRKSWELDLDPRIVEAYQHFKERSTKNWPTFLSPAVLQNMAATRIAIIEKSQDLGTFDAIQTRLATSSELAALDNFLKVVDKPESYKPAKHDHSITKGSVPTNPVPPKIVRAELAEQHCQNQRQPKLSTNSPVSIQSYGDNVLRQRIASLRGKLFDVPRDTSRDVIEDEIRRLEQLVLASSPTPSLETNAAAHQQTLVRKISTDQKPSFRSLKEINEQVLESATVNHAESKRARRPEESDRAYEGEVPLPKRTSLPFQAINPPFKSDPTMSFSTDQSSEQLGSNSEVISDLKTQVAELKDLIRGLIFQQMSRPGTFSTLPVPEEIPVSIDDQGVPRSALGLDSIKEILNTPPTSDTTMEKKYAVEKRTLSTTIDSLPSGSSDASRGSLKIKYSSPHFSSESPKASQEPSKTTHTSPRSFSASPKPDLQGAFPGKASPVLPAKSAQSLLQELFPEESKENEAGEVTKGPGSPARIPIPQVPLTPAEDSGVPRRQSAERGHVRRIASKVGPLVETSAALELRYASKSLTEEDFRNIIPRGLHMQEWTQRGEFIKVFPKRDPWTLEQTGNYYIIFSNEENAKAYKAHVSHVHELARQHTPTSLTSEIAPPPGYIINGEDVFSLVQSYTLIPPQQKLFLQLLVAPFTPLQQNLFKRGGYAQILGEGREGVAQVLIIFLEGRQPSYFDISDAIHLDGQRRGLEWKLQSSESAIRKVDMREAVKKEDNGPLFEVGDTLSGVEADGPLDSGRRKRTVQDRLTTPTYGQRWILSFESVEEAKRFALQWHGRAFPWHKRASRKWKEDRFGEQILMVRAEVLW